MFLYSASFMRIGLYYLGLGHFNHIQLNGELSNENHDYHHRRRRRRRRRRCLERNIKLFARFLANVNSSSRSLYVVVRPSVVCRLSVVCLSSVTFVRPTQTIEIFRNVSTP